MTMQILDYIWYNNEKYILIEAEKNKNLIGSADFNVDGIIASTACHRGFIAEYFIENNFLFGIKTVDNSKEFLTFIDSQKTALSYTGAIIIARDKPKSIHPVISWDDYIGFDEAFELYFIDGELVELTDLSDAINDWKSRKDMFCGNYYYERRKEIAKEYLQYEYGSYY